MLATYSASENPSRQILRAVSILVHSPSFHIRSVRLAIVAALRTAGWAPWLLVLGWGAFAALQEPLLFRSYGIRLPIQAAWPAGLVVLALLVASAPSPRSFASQVVTGKALTAFIASVIAVGLAAASAARVDLAGLDAAFAWAAAFALLATPLAVVLFAARSLGAWGRWSAQLLALGLTIPLAVRFDTEPWSLRPLAATLCLWGAAIGLACRPTSFHAHRHPR
jgi:hypothetical protein